MSADNAGDESLLVRTDFRSNVAWRALCALVQQPVGEMQAFVRLIDDRDLERATLERLAAVFAPSGQGFLFVADATTFEHPEQPLLVVDLLDAPPLRTFRVMPQAAWCVQNNLPLGNMDFDDFAAAADSSGIFRELVKRWSRRELETVPLSEADRSYLGVVGLPILEGTTLTPCEQVFASDSKALGRVSVVARDDEAPIVVDSAGRVWALEPTGHRFVNSSLALFGQSLGAYAEYRRSVLADEAEEALRTVLATERRLQAIDPTAMRDTDSYWSTIVEQMRHGTL